MSNEAKVQGSAHHFIQDRDDGTLSLSMIKERKKLDHFRDTISFIDNTNLHKLPTDCTGALVAVSVRDKLHKKRGYGNSV